MLIFDNKNKIQKSRNLNPNKIIGMRDSGTIVTQKICENHTEIGTKPMSRLAAPYLLCSIVVFIIFYFFVFAFLYKIKKDNLNNPYKSIASYRSNE